MDYVPVRVSTLRGDQKINFNLFVHINGKQILYIRKGDSFEGTRLTRLKEKKLRKMYIVADEETLYRDYLNRNIEMAYGKNSEKTIEDRVEIVQGIQQSHAEEVMENPADELAYHLAKEGSSQYVRFLLQEERALENMLHVENNDGNIAHHGVTVGTLAVGLARRLSLPEKDIEMITLGSLLHDLGHLESGLNIARPISALSTEELRTYYAHPQAGYDVVANLGHFDKAVTTIIHQHEEKSDGSGFPNKLNESHTDQLALIVSSANALDRLTTFEKFSREEAARMLMIDKVGTHPLQHIQILQSIIKTMRI